MRATRFLTGITTSGTPHLGNYVGSIRPAVRASLAGDTESFYFLADYHALIKVDEPTRIQRSTLEIAASWLACGLDPERVVFYRQSDVPEIPELAWFFSCVLGKGVLNRAHAYKAAVDKNTLAGTDPDADVNVGLFMYPVLMGADILMFNAHKVPVGRDQVQHIEMARDMGAGFNHRYGEHFVLPDAVIEDNVATLPGLDGRKMSKSYDNTIALFAPRDQLRKLIGAIVTDSRAPGEPKETEGSALFQIFQAFANEAETAAFAEAYADGIAWGEAKQRLFERIDSEIGPLREKYHALMAHPQRIEEILLAGAAKARAHSTPFMRTLRHAVGLRPLGQADRDTPLTTRATHSALKQYREKDGLFYFKLINAEGELVLQSKGFSNPKDAGQCLATLRAQGAVGLTTMEQMIDRAVHTSAAAVDAALSQLG